MPHILVTPVQINLQPDDAHSPKHKSACTLSYEESWRQMNAMFSTYQQPLMWTQILFWPTSDTPGWGDWQSPHSPQGSAAEGKCKNVCLNVQCTSWKIASRKILIIPSDKLVFFLSKMDTNGFETKKL